MADTVTKLYQSTLPSSDGVLYAGIASGAVVRNIHVVNTDTVSRTFSIGLNTSGTLGVTNYFVYSYTLLPGQIFDWSGYAVLDASSTTGKINGVASAASVVSCIISGVTL